MKNQLGQCTLRLANIRPGLRRIVFRNERDNKENPMAIALVEIRTYTLAEIEEKTEVHKARIEVWKGLKVNLDQTVDYEKTKWNLFNIPQHQRAMFEPSLDASELGAMNKLKGDSMIEVCLCITPLCVHDFKRIYSPADKARPVEDTA